MNSRRMVITLGALLLMSGCTQTYYKAAEKFGYEKRDILVSRVEKARDDQTAAKEQFKTTMEQFKALTNFNGGDLEDEYNKINASYAACQTRADDVSKRIKKVDEVANDMFKEWEGELSQYSDASLKESSRQKLEESKSNYAKLLGMMKTSESKMPPVLAKFHDQVLFLKHNLNAAAINSLGNTTVQIDMDVQNLLKDMDASINEANSFIDNLKKT